MKKGYFTGWRTVLTFSLGRQIKTKVYVILTSVVALLLFCGSIALLFAANSERGSSEADPGLGDPPAEYLLRGVVVSDATGEFDSAAWLEGEWGPEAFSLAEYSSVEYTSAEDLARGVLSRLGEFDLLLVISDDGGQYKLEIVTPEGTGISSAELAEFGGYVSAAFRAELIGRSGIDPTLFPRLIAPINIGANTKERPDTDAVDGDGDGADALRRNISMAVSYLMIFIMYMLVMFYGQSAASSVILEKTSRLMDFFLVSVKPAAMILGKVLAAAAAGFLQIGIWIAALVGGLRLGLILLPHVFGSISPDIETLLSLLRGIGAMFSPGGIAVALLMIAVGFLLYCSLAAVGGSMASKPEDLSSTNTIFALTVVASFLLSISTGSSGGMVSSEKWLIYFPFTAIMVTPGRAMTGEIALLEGILSVTFVAALAFLFIMLAGRVYEMMSFYRGNPPTPIKIIKMLRSGKDKKRARNR